MSTWSSQSLRDFESEIIEYSYSGKIRTPMHLYSRNDDAIMRVTQNIDEADWGIYTWRIYFSHSPKNSQSAKPQSVLEQGQYIALLYHLYGCFPSAKSVRQISIAVGIVLAIKWLAQENQLNIKAETRIECVNPHNLGTQYAGDFRDAFKSKCNYVVILLLDKVGGFFLDPKYSCNLADSFFSLNYKWSN